MLWLIGLLAISGLTSASTECEVCKFVVSVVDNFADQQWTKDEIKQGLDEICSHLGRDAQICKNLVDQYFDSIYEMIIKHIQPDVICPLLRLCPKEVNDPQEPQTIVCDMCKYVVGFIHNELVNKSDEKQIKEDVLEVCSYIDKFSGTKMCTEYVNKYFDVIWGLLEKDVTVHNICIITGLCSTPKEIVCDTCKFVVGIIHDELVNKTDEKKVKEDILEVCTIIDKISGMTMCKDYVNKYFDVIWDLLEKDITVDKVCILTGLCQKKIEQPKTIVCDTCKYVVGIIHNELINKTDQKKAKEEVLEVCAYVDKFTGSKLCTTYVNQYFDVIWDLLEKKATVEQICIVTGLCPKQTEKEIKQGVVCDVCKKVIGFIQENLNNKKEEAEAKAETLKFCKFIDSVVGNTYCTDFINANFDKVWQMLEQEITVEEVCIKSGLCPKLNQEKLQADFKWENCDNPKIVTTVSLSPDPIVIPGDIEVAAEVKGTVDVANPYKVVLVLKKHTPFGDIKLPCIKYPFGSCTIENLCDFLKQQFPGDCPAPFQKYKFPCHCPFKAGDYKLAPTKATIPDPGVPIPAGIYKLEVRGTDGAGAQTICVNAQIKLQGA